MPQRRPKQTLKRDDARQRLRQALTKRTKAELIDTLLELAEADRRILRQIEEQFAVEAPPRELVAATRQAIADATDFDERDINRNFDYDFAAYDAVKRNLGRLIDLGELPSAMELSLELMKQGSRHVEMSDEQLMTIAISQCVQVVVAAVEHCHLPPAPIAA